MEEPPVGLDTPAGLVDCPADPARGPLSCTYRTSRLRALRGFERTARRLAEGKGEYGELVPRIAPVQVAGIARGRMVRDGLLNVQGFSQEAYEQLLDISSAFLETVQATALATVEVVAERDATVGRRAAVATACLKLWLRAYIVGVTDGRPERALPTFAVR